MIDKMHPSLYDCLTRFLNNEVNSYKDIDVLLIKGMFGATAIVL